MERSLNRLHTIISEIKTGLSEAVRTNIAKHWLAISREYDLYRKEVHHYLFETNG